MVEAHKNTTLASTSFRSPVAQSMYCTPFALRTPALTRTRVTLAWGWIVNFPVAMAAARLVSMLVR